MTRRDGKLVRDFECPIPVGAPVVVREPNIKTWRGVAIAVKWSFLTGYWVDVRDDDNIVRICPAHRVEVVTP